MYSTDRVPRFKFILTRKVVCTFFAQLALSPLCAGHTSHRESSQLSYAINSGVWTWYVGVEAGVEAGVEEGRSGHEAGMKRA
jgi:hypothetical protein